MTELDAPNVLPMDYKNQWTNSSVTCNTVALPDPAFTPNATKTDRVGKVGVLEESCLSLCKVQFWFANSADQLRHIAVAQGQSVTGFCGSRS